IHGARGCESVRELGRTAPGFSGVRRDPEDAARVRDKVYLQRRIELEEAAHKRRPNVIKSGLEGVPANRLAYVILELVFALDGLLRDVGVGAELRAGKGDERGARGAVNQVVPILKSGSK